MGQPEGEEHRVEATRRLPGEQVRLDELHRQPSYASTGQGEHLRGGVEGGHRAGAGSQQRCPVAGAAGQLQNVPGDRQLLDAPVPVLAEVGVVIVGCMGAVVGELLGHKRPHPVVHGAESAIHKQPVAPSSRPPMQRAGRWRSKLPFRPPNTATIAFGEEFLYELKAGLAGQTLLDGHPRVDTQRSVKTGTVVSKRVAWDPAVRWTAEARMTVR